MSNRSNVDDISELRVSYKKAKLSIDDLDSNPIDQFKKWLQNAIDADIIEPTAMTLATVNESSQPSLRNVLLKGISDKGFVFYTNYESRKGKEINSNSRVSVNFLWKELERQVTIIGFAEKIPKDDSEKYFKTRPIGHQIGAWASTQSSKIPHREWMQEREKEMMSKFANVEVPYPEFWGGFNISPIEIEFWQGRENRMHDRIQYVKNNDDWIKSRLSP